MQKFALCKNPLRLLSVLPAPAARAGPEGLHSQPGLPKAPGSHGGGSRVQLSSRSEEDRSLRQHPPSLWSRLNRPLVPGVIAFVAWLGFALARWQIWAKGHLSLFIMAGHVYTHRAQLPRGLLLVPSAGYEGPVY